MTASFPLSLTDRFAWIMRELHAAVAARIRFPPVTGAIIIHICARLRAIAAEFSALAEKIRAGTYVAPRRIGRRAGRSRAAPRTCSSPIRLHYELGLPPWRPGWLHRVAPNNAGVWAGALRELFSDPEMMAVLAVAPRMRRILRPLCFMLGLEASLLTPPLPHVAAAIVADGDHCGPPPAHAFAAPDVPTNSDGPAVAEPYDVSLPCAIFRAM